MGINTTEQQSVYYQFTQSFRCYLLTYYSTLLPERTVCVENIDVISMLCKKYHIMLLHILQSHFAEVTIQTIHRPITPSHKHIPIVQ